MRGHWIGGTRKLNKHWQSGEGSIHEFSRWFTTIKYDDDYYCFAPSYQVEELPKLRLHTSFNAVNHALIDTWTTFGTVALVPSFNNKMNAVISFDLEDIRENGQITTRTLSPSDRVKIIIPTYRASVYVCENGTAPFTAGYTYGSTPTIPAGAEILWQDDNDAAAYQSRYSDSLGIQRNTWNAWDFAFYYQNLVGEYIETYTEWDDVMLMNYEDIGLNIKMGYYDHNTAISGTPIAENLMSGIMCQRRSNNLGSFICPFNSLVLFFNDTYDYNEGKNYSIYIKLELVSLDLQERTIV